MKNFISIICLSIISSHSLLSQDIIGTVLDESKSPLQQVVIYSANSHAHSDEKGKFSISGISVGDTLRAKYLGYLDYEHIVTSVDYSNDLRIIMKEKMFDLSQITISKSVKSINSITAIDLEVDAVNSSQEVLRRVPGLLIGQHAGGGKAEQLFLRGFDIDHGTDIALNVDGIPVNMVSHAHGQGYSDLHFIIPETIENIDFGKGPYYTDIGNFNTAGYVNFKTKDRLANSMFSLEYGDFNSSRVLGMFDLLQSKTNQSAYIAAEYIQSDGPVESPQNFNRLNLMSKYRVETEAGDIISLIVSRMHSKWDASGQIPQRLVDDGSITRFGSVDDTEGGLTSRTNLGITHSKPIDDNTFIKTNLFYTKYDFELFSNFTFFLNDPINGDQIRQHEDRSIYGMNTALFHNREINNIDTEISYQLGFRYDDINDNELSRTANRYNTLSYSSLGEVDESNIYSSIGANLDFGKWLVNTGLRLDYFNFSYTNRLSPVYDNQSVDKVLISPKLNLIYNQNNKAQYYLKTGMGFHSNDSRVVIDELAEVDLPVAYGTDLGVIFKPFNKLVINSALWYLFLEQEFVYVGDEGIVEPSGKTKRQGIDLSLRYQLAKNVFLNTDVTYTDASPLDTEEEEIYIPLAVDLMATGGISIRNINGFSGALRCRFIGDRPANEDYSITALGYFIADLNAQYDINNLTLGVKIENLLNTEWNEAQFATESRLFDELEPVEELHFTPGVPFFVKGNISYKF